ncbi:MAG: hypothetical protein ACE147_14350 [Candidatus Methylomirabilales bacterium]
MRRAAGVLLLLSCIGLAGCLKTYASAPGGGLPVYRCSPKGRHQMADALMQCIAANPKPGQVFELDLRSWEYRF